MTERSLQVTYRKGRAFAAYLHLSHPTGEKSAKTVASPDGLLVVDYGATGRPVGRRDHGSASSSLGAAEPAPCGTWRAALGRTGLQARSSRVSRPARTKIVSGDRSNSFTPKSSSRVVVRAEIAADPV